MGAAPVASACPCPTGGKLQAVCSAGPELARRSRFLVLYVSTLPLALVQASQRRELYQLSTVEGTFTGHRTALNGNELLMNGSALPALEPVVHQNAPDPLLMPELSVTFVVLPNERVRGCSA